jgi:mono/diheme cytochrome c family protein
MRHVAVRRVAALLGLLFLLWAGVFAWMARRTPAPTPAAGPSPPVTEPAPAAPSSSDGAALFEAHCTPCHAADDLRPALAGNDTARAAMDAFLADHGDATPEEDRLIVEYLGGP